jgi:prepilin-type N-terminal cleavage/methylation domain-containing protein
VSRPRQHGFTLIELMVALVVSSLLVGMILAIFSRMSLSYRGQQQIAGVQQVLAAARATIELDAKQAGLEVSQGFKIASDGSGAGSLIHQPIHITDSALGPDQIAFFYADTTTQAVVTDPSTFGAGTLTVDQPVGFIPGSLVVLVNVDVSGAAPVMPPSGDPVIAKYTACVLQIDPAAGSVAAANPGTIRFSTAPPWGVAGLVHCPAITTNTMLYNFVARAYRIDTSTPARAALGPLQQSPTGGLLGTAADNWTDLAYGFTDIQTALRVYEANDITDLDGDADPQRDWYSDNRQDNVTATGPVPLLPGPPWPPAPIQMSISLVARTDRDIEGIATAQTPTLTLAANPGNNTIGNHPSVPLPSATNDLLKGSRIYRYVTFQVDFRNLGVGR